MVCGNPVLGTKIMSWCINSFRLVSLLFVILLLNFPAGCLLGINSKSKIYNVTKRRVSMTKKVYAECMSCYNVCDMTGCESYDPKLGVWCGIGCSMEKEHSKK